MSDLGLIRHNLFRKALRTTLMIVSILVAFLVFGLLSSVEKVFNAGVDLSKADRLVTVNKINFTVSMPYAYVNRVRGVDGVRNVSYANWFGGYFQETRNFVQSFAVDVPTYLEAYPELLMPEDQRQAAIANRTGFVIGRALADQYGWNVGDTVPLSTNIWQNADGNYVYELEVVAIFDGEDQQTPTNYGFLHYDYFDEYRVIDNDNIGWMIINTDSVDVNERVIEQIDAQFANSPAETETTTEAAFNAAFVQQIGNIRLIITAVVGSAFFTILAIVGTTMVMAIRERTKEIAVMKTIGFPSPRIFRIVLGESLLLSVLGGGLGLGLAALILAAAAPAAASVLPGLALTGDIALTALAVMVALGLATGLLPAVNAIRTDIVSALGKE